MKQVHNISEEYRAKIKRLYKKTSEPGYEPMWITAANNKNSTEKGEQNSSYKSKHH
jgi:hypothetical protein